MSLTKRVGLVVGAASLSLTGGSWAGTSEANDQNVNARIAELEAKLAQLEAQNGQQWMTEQRAGEIRALVQDVLQDADTRASLLQGGMSGGHDGHFFLASSDGNYRLNVGGQIQARYMLNIQEEGAALDDDTTRGGFENTRTKLFFWGNVFSPEWTYMVEGNFFHEGGSFSLEDAWINYDYGDGFGIRVGQFKAPLMREELVHSSMQQAVERSLINSAFTADRVQGIMLNWEQDTFRAGVSYNDGFRSLNSAALTYDTEWAFTGRAEFLASGNWDQFEDFTSWQDGDTGIMFGAGAHYQQGEYGTALTGEITTLVLTGDVSLEFGGANLFGAVVYSDFDVDGGALDDFNPWGAVVQGGVFLTEDWELFGRFEFGDSDIDMAEDLMILTVGVTKFWDGHNLKWTTDVGYAFDQVDGFWAGTAPGSTSDDASLAGWRTDATEEDDGQLVIRTQWQLLF